MLIAALALLAALTTSPEEPRAGAAEQPDRWCYDVALLGRVRDTNPQGLVDEWNAYWLWDVEVIKVYEGDATPDRIVVGRLGHAEFIREYLQNTIILAAREPDGRYFLRASGWGKVDGRGLVSRGQVEQLARENRLKRCGT